MTLSEDYYIGVYELTQAQYVNFRTTAEGSAPANGSVFQGDKRPFENCSYNDMRGDGATYLWTSTGHALDQNKPLGRLRSLTGIDTFDFPTEAQWEFACRAGSTGYYYNDIPKGNANLMPLAWFKVNSTNEATNAAEDMFGEERLLDTLNQHAHANPEELIHAVQAAVDQFAGDTSQFDDITMLCFKLNA